MSRRTSPVAACRVGISPCSAGQGRRYCFRSALLWRIGSWKQCSLVVPHVYRPRPLWLRPPRGALFPEFPRILPVAYSLTPGRCGRLSVEKVHVGTVWYYRVKGQSNTHKLMTPKMWVPGPLKEWKPRRELFHGLTHTRDLCSWWEKKVPSATVANFAVCRYILARIFLAVVVCVGIDYCFPDLSGGAPGETSTFIYSGVTSLRNVSSSVMAWWLMVALHGTVSPVTCTKVYTTTAIRRE